jgi:hypothetical protein
MTTQRIRRDVGLQHSSDVPSSSLPAESQCTIQLLMVLQICIVEGTSRHRTCRSVVQNYICSDGASCWRPCQPRQTVITEKWAGRSAYMCNDTHSARDVQIANGHLQTSGLLVQPPRTLTLLFVEPNSVIHPSSRVTHFLQGRDCQCAT